MACSVYAITGPEPKPTLWIDYPAKNVDVLSTRTHLNQFVRYKMVQGSKITFTFAVDHYGNQLPELLVLTEYGGRLAMEEKEFPSSAIIYNVTHRDSGEFKYIFAAANPTVYLGFRNKQPATRNTFIIEASTLTYDIKSLNISKVHHMAWNDANPTTRVSIGSDVTGLLLVSNATLDKMTDWKNNGVQLRYEPDTDYIYVLFLAVSFLVVLWCFKRWFTTVQGNCVKWYQSRFTSNVDVEASMDTSQVAPRQLQVISTRVLGVTAYIVFLIVIPVVVTLKFQTILLSKIVNCVAPILPYVLPYLYYGTIPALLTLHTTVLALRMLKCVRMNLWGQDGTFFRSARNERRVVDGEGGNAEEAARLLEGDSEPCQFRG